MSAIKCPKCGSSNVIRITYGLPAPETIDAYHRGEIRLGGCCITDDNPTHYCKDCKTEFLKEKKSKQDFFGYTEGICGVNIARIVPDARFSC